MLLAKASTMRLGLVNEAPQLRLLLLRKLNISGCPVLFEAVNLGRARDGNETLGSNPSKGNLGQSGSLLSGYLAELVDNCEVLVEVVTLELGGCVLTNG
jgi:hypothetical protein